MPEVSVVLPTYNCVTYLEEAIVSVLSQTFKDIELIVVDDGSTDGTAEILKRYGADARLRYIKQEHAGLSAARNRGIEEARGEYVSFIDADDIFLPCKVERQLEAMRARPTTDVVYAPWRYFYDQDIANSFPSTYARLSGDIFFFLKRSNFIHVSTVMVRHSFLGGTRFDASLKSHEDWDFFLKLACSGARFLCIDDELCMIRVRKTSMTASRPTMDSSRAIVGERAKVMWKELKSGIGLNDKSGVSCLLRYVKLRARAALAGFPDAPRFNNPLPFWG